MGVLACNRNGCENIICDRYSPTYGYICYECFNELVHSGLTTNVEEFMNSMKIENNLEAAWARFEVEFPTRE